MLTALGTFLLPGCSYLFPLDDVVLWTALLIYGICQPVVTKSLFSVHLASNFVLTLFVGDLVDVATDG